MSSYSHHSDVLVRRVWKDFQIHGYVTMVSYHPKHGYRAEIADPAMTRFAIGSSQLSEDDAKEKAVARGNIYWPVE
jgi:hypothetical protein